MQKALKRADSKLLSEIAIKGIQEKKGHDINCLDLKGIDNSVSDFFIICHGNSNTQVDAIAQSVVHEIKKELGEDPWHKEGFENAEWILLDYTDVVVHIFQKNIREFYRLEELWADAESVQIQDEY